MQIVRFLVTGAPGAGKTTFLHSVAAPLVGSPESAEMIVNEALKLELYAATAPPHGSTWKTMIDLVLGVVLLVDGTNAPYFAQIQNTIEALRAAKALPLIVAITKQDLSDAHSPAIVRTFLPEDPDYKVFPCVASNQQSAENVLLALIYQILS